MCERDRLKNARSWLAAPNTCDLHDEWQVGCANNWLCSTLLRRLTSVYTAETRMPCNCMRKVDMYGRYAYTAPYFQTHEAWTRIKFTAEPNPMPVCLSRHGDPMLAVEWTAWRQIFLGCLLAAGEPQKAIQKDTEWIGLLCSPREILVGLMEAVSSVLHHHAK